MVNLKRGLLTCLLVLFSFGVKEVVHADEVVTVLRASEVSISQGESGYVDVSLEGSVDIAELSFAIFYNEEELDVGYVDASLMVDAFSVDYEVDGQIDVVYEGEEALDTEGTILRIFFNVEEDAPTGLERITIERDVVKDSLGEDVHLIPLEGTITVEENLIEEKEVTFYSRVSLLEGLSNLVVFEVYSDDYQGISSFEGQVFFDSSHFFLYDAGFLDAINAQTYGHVIGQEGQVSFTYAGQFPLEDGEALLQVRLEVTDLEAFTSSIDFEASSLFDQDLRQVASNQTSKEVSLDQGVFTEDKTDLYVTSYGGSENQAFDLYVKIEAGSHLFEGDFLLEYDKDLLEVVRVQVGPYVNQKGGVLFFEDDVYDGDIAFTYFNEDGLVEEDTLLVVTFEAMDDISESLTNVTIEGLRTIDQSYSEMDFNYEAGVVDFYTAFLVRFLNFDGSVLSSVIYEEGEEIVAPEVPLREGTVFEGWDTSFDLAMQTQTIKALYSLEEEAITFEDHTLVYDGEEHSLQVEGLPNGAYAEYSDQDFVDVGDYTVSADVYLDEVYQFTKEATLRITPKPLTLTVGSHERVYDSVGSIAYTVNGKVAGDDLDIEVFTLDGYDVGTHALTAVVHNPNYQTTVIDGSLEITKATYDMSGISFPSKTFTKGGNTYFLELEGTLPEGVSVTYINNGKTEVGRYTITAEFYGDYDNYESIPPMTAVLTIDPPTILGPVFMDQFEVYDGTNKTIEVNNLLSGTTVTYNVDNSERNAGEYTVEATVSKDGYEDMVLVATLTIGKASYDMSDVVFEDGSFDFDGDTNDLFISGDLPSGVSVTYENNGQVEVGTYVVLAHFTSEDPNYLPIPSLSATLTILDNDYVDIVFEDKTLVYNGEEHVIEIENLPLGASVDYSPRNDYTDAGVYEVTATISLDGYDDYVMTAVLTIEKEVLVIQANNLSSIYGEDIKELTYTVEGTIYDEEVDIDLDRDKDEDAGVYVIHVEAEHENYDITLINGTYTIEKATYDMSGISFNHQRIVYDGDDHFLEILGDLPSGVDVEYLNNGQVSPGIYLVTAVFTGDSDNYQLIPSLQARLIIEEAVMSDLVFDSLTVDYDGLVHALEVEGLPSGASVLYSPGNQFVRAGVYEITATVSLEGYEDAVLVATLTITGQDVTEEELGFEMEEYIYDNTLKTLIMDGVLPEGVLGVEYVNQRRTEAGENLVLLKVFVEEAYNPVGTLSAILRITPAEIEGIDFVGGTYVYSGEEKFFTLSGTMAQYGHELEVEYSGDLAYTDAGEYTVSVTLSHPNYQTKVIEDTMVIEKAPRVFLNSHVDIDVYDDLVEITSERFEDLISYRLEDGPWTIGTLIVGLDEYTEYSFELKIRETKNYQESNVLSFEVETFLSDETVAGLIEAIGEVSLSAREEVLFILEQIDLLMESEQAAQLLAIDQVIEDYNLLVENYQYEYKLAGDVVENLFPMELLAINYQMATPSDIRRRDLI